MLGHHRLHALTEALGGSHEVPSTAATHARVFESLLRMGAVTPGDLVVLTMGQQGVAGRTNVMQILTVPGAPPQPASA